MRVLILGGGGFIGRNLVSKIKKTSHQIFSPARKQLDLRNYAGVKSYFKKIRPEAIINCAGNTGSVHYVTKFAADVIDDNIQISLNIYRAAREASLKTKVINPISNCSYPGDIGFQHEKDWLKGPVHDSVFSYGNYKRSLYYIAYCYAKQCGIRSLNFLVPGVFGPLDHTDPNRTHALNGMIIRMIKAQKEGRKQFEIWGTGKPVREWMYVDDMVKFLIASLTIKEDLLYPVNLGQGKGYSIKQTAQIIAQELPYEGKLVFNTNFQDGALKKVLAGTIFKKIFPNYIFYDFRKGIRQAIRYYKSIL